jgi:hypothetical protein
VIGESGDGFAEMTERASKAIESPDDEGVAGSESVEDSCEFFPVVESADALSVNTRKQPGRARPNNLRRAILSDLQLFSLVSSWRRTRLVTLTMLLFAIPRTVKRTILVCCCQRRRYPAGVCRSIPAVVPCLMF